MRKDRYNIARLKHTIDFGDESDAYETNPNTGMPETEFVKAVTVRCGTYSLSVNQTLSLTGTRTTDDLILVVRHNDDLRQYHEAMYEGVKYQVSNWSVDETLNAYDLVTLTKISGR